MSGQSLGRFGESWAAGFLTRHGYQILERNVRYRTGEIDIVAMDGLELVFVEVKTRRGSAFGLPEASITPSRFRRLATAIQEYLSRDTSAAGEYRVDVVAIEVGRTGAVQRCRLIQNVECPVA